MNNYEQLVINTLEKLQKPYRKTGDEYYLTTCFNPTHNEKHPSFYVHFPTLSGRCFACGFKVDKEFFLEDKLDEHQIELIERELQYKKLKDKLITAEMTKSEYKMNDEVVLPLKDEELKEPYKGISLELLQELSVYITRTGKYADRLIFPIKYNDIVKAFSSRYLTGTKKDKWKHSKGFDAKSTIYPYNILSKNKENYVILCEGITDTLSFIDAGYNAMCNFGVAYNLNENKIKELLKLGIDTIYLSFDKDVAGLQAEISFYNNKELNNWFDIKLLRKEKEFEKYYKSDCKDFNEYWQRNK